MKRLLRRLLGGTAYLALLLTAALAIPSGGRANGVPMRIQLSYLQGLSNFGAADATGQAELSYSEGLLTVRAQGLTPLAGDRYAVWLVKSSSNVALDVGLVDAGTDGTAAFDGRLGSITSYDYDLVILTAQADGDVAGGPSSKRAIGGFFTPVQAPQANATATVGQTQPQTLPATLPLTGDPPIPAEPRLFGFTRHQAGFGLLLGGAAILAITIMRRRVRRA